MAGEAGSADYGAAKAAVASMTRTLAMELAPHVNVNCIAPGIIRTRVLAMIGEDVAEAYRRRTLLGRLGEPDDIANAALYLASDEAKYVSGHTLVVDAGQTSSGMVVNRFHTGQNRVFKHAGGREDL